MKLTAEFLSALNMMSDLAIVYQYEDESIYHINRTCGVFLEIDDEAERNMLLSELFTVNDYEAIFKNGKYTLINVIGEIAFELQINRNNVLHFIRWKISKLLINSQECCLMIGHDITLERSKNLESNRIESYLRNLISFMPGNFYWKDLNGRYLNCNDSVLKMLGLSSVTEIIGKTDYDLWPEHAEKIRENDFEVMESKIPVILEEAVHLASGYVMYFKVIKVPLLNDNNEVVGIIGNSLDITDLKDAQAALRMAKEKAETANIAKSAFLATMSHELRTPLNGILGMSQILKNLAMSNEQTEYVDIIERSGKSLLGLVNDILDLSTIESGNVTLKKTAFSLRKMIDDIVITSSSLVSQKPVELLAEYETDFPEYVIADELRIRQILLNLIGNAAKFTLQGSITIKVRTEMLPDHNIKLWLTVADTGIGIPEDKLESIFERFTQVESSYNRRFEGAGLGLAIAQKLLLLMDGEISVISKLGVGSHFSIELLLQVADEIKKITSSAVKPTKKLLSSELKVLLVEDNLINQKVALVFLKECGAIVDVAATGKEAIALYKENNYNLVLMDLSLPDGDGISITKALLAMEHNQGVKIVALTAHVLMEDREKCLAAGMQDVLTKPLARSEIIRVLSKIGETK